MKIEIQPKNIWLPGKGEITINLLSVVARLDLGVGASASYELLRRTTTDDAVNDEFFGLSGTIDLTPDQFAGWGTDDLYFVKCAATNLGLTPL